MIKVYKILIMSDILDRELVGLVAIIGCLWQG